jgi:signal transduction histidine kinase
VAAVFRRQMRLTRLKNDLLATVSHELKTPLASIRLLVDTLLDAKEFDGPKLRSYLQLVAKENARLSHLIDNFLSFSRMERGKQAFEFAGTSAAEIAQRAVEVVAERFQAPGCHLEVQVAVDTPALQADPDALVTAVLNLLDNAYKYTGDQKQVVLRSYAENGNVCFAVSDNGAGLSPHAIKRVFRPFYQVDRRLSRSTGGCGLGLSIVQFIVAAHGGTVDVESRPGAGSTFTLSIPQSRS